jgi:hypothetical protein
LTDAGDVSPNYDSESTGLSYSSSAITQIEEGRGTNAKVYEPSYGCTADLAKIHKGITGRLTSWQNAQEIRSSSSNPCNQAGLAYNSVKEGVDGKLGTCTRSQRGN